MAEDPDADLSALIGYNIKRALSVVQSDLAEVLGAHGLRAVSYSALRVVVRHPGISQSDLADALRIEKSNLVQLIDELSANGLLRRTPVPGDRRRHALMPTETGIALAEIASRAVAAHEDRIFSALNDDERSEMIRLLRLVWAPDRQG